MFELTISCNIDKQAYISQIYKKLSPEIKSASGLAVKQNYQGRSHFSIAVKDHEKDYFKSKIIDHIVFMIIDDYKYNFFKEKLNFTDNNIIFQSFLRAIAIFDSDIDREYIIKQIDFSGSEILVDSLYYFKLQELRRRWQKTADIIFLNQITKNPSSMIEVLKYLTTMSISTVSQADVVISKKGLKLKNTDTSKNYKNNFSGISSFLSEIIEMNPAKINIEVADDSDGEIVDVLSKIFYDKINF